ncbi:synaptogenesis protein syg-2 [Trichonephila clavipes]|nr:synaptogenesis protein syg-2 [Trichonephila clavipes]
MDLYVYCVYKVADWLRCWTPVQHCFYRIVDSVHSEEKEGKSRFIASSYLTIRPMVQDDGAKFSCEAFHKALDHRMRNEVTLSVLRKFQQGRVSTSDEQRLGRPVSGRTNLVCAVIEQLMDCIKGYGLH